MSSLTARKPPSFALLVQQFFTEYLVQQRAVSSRTVACYRDALMLFLDFAHRKVGKAPTALRLADIQPDLILMFLDHLEQQRHNAVRSRNLRLTALRAFLKFAGRRDVASLHVVERALAVPMKRFERPMLGFLTREEMAAVLGQPGATWTSQRDHLLLAMLYNTGARGLRDHRRARRRRGARWRRLRASARQGAQAALGTAVEEQRARDPCVAAAQPASGR
jgi:site-specific recombinase XerD